MGGTGLLAVNWAFARKHRDEIFLAVHDRQISIEGVFVKKIDLTSVADISSAIDVIEPDFIVNAASLTSVEACEASLSQAEEVNTRLAFYIAKACNALGVKLVHISTDHLFSGDREFIDEQEPVCPLNEYGKTKSRAEKLVLGVNPEFLVIRTNFYGWGPTYRQSFSDLIVDSLRRGEGVNLFDDVFYTPILIEVLIEMVEKLISVGAGGVFNIVGDDRVTKYQFGLALAKEFELDDSLVKPISILSMADLVLRPMDMSLSNKKASNLLGNKIGGIGSHLQRLKLQEQKGLLIGVRKL